MILERFQPAHFDLLELQPEQQYLRAAVTHEYLASLASHGPAYTAWFAGRPAFCGGFAEAPEGAHLWCFIAAGAPLLGIHRGVMRAFEVYPYKRLVATTETGFVQGRRWLELLGFQFQDTLIGYGPDGRDHDLFERVTA